MTQVRNRIRDLSLSAANTFDLAFLAESASYRRYAAGRLSKRVPSQRTFTRKLHKRDLAPVWGSRGLGWGRAP